MSLKFHVIIPARWHSTRLPEKMLADIGGLPMVIRTAQQALKSSAASVTIATDDARILEAAKAYGIQAVMTKESHQSGTDRLAEAALALGLAENEIVVNVQGDEPLIDPLIIDQVARALMNDTESAMATCASICEPHRAGNPNVVKVVIDRNSRALYFSRQQIPAVRNDKVPVSFLHHIGIYSYRVSFLKGFPQLEPGTLETIEMLEQLRVLEHGFKIHVCNTDIKHHGGVDTQEDLERFRQLFSG